MVEMLELVEEAFDAVAQFVGDRVMRDEDFASSVGRDDGFRSRFGDEGAQFVAVVGLIGDDAGRLGVVEQRGRHGDIASFAAGKNEAQGASKRIGEHVDFGGQSSSGTPQSLILAPPFRSRPAGGREPEWCRASGIGCRDRRLGLSKIRSHTPFLAQRVKRLWTLFHLPYRSGRSLQRAPDRNTHRTPSTNSLRRRIGQQLYGAGHDAPTLPVSRPASRRAAPLLSTGLRANICVWPSDTISW